MRIYGILWPMRSCYPLYQTERAECGLVSLAMIASFHGLKYDLASLRARFPVSSKGSSLKGLIAVARELGLETRAVRCEIDDLRGLRQPAILHWRMQHFVVLVKCTPKRFIINDPANGRVSLSRSEMNEYFTGIALEAWPSPQFEKEDRRNALRLATVIPTTRQVLSAIVALIVFALGVELVALTIPILQQFVIDDALVTADSELISIIAIATAVLLLGQSATSAVRGIVQRNLSSTLSIIVPSHVFRHMMSLPPSWFERRSAADVANRMNSGNSIVQTVTTTITSSGIDGLVGIVALCIMTMYSISLASIVIATFLAYTFTRIFWFDSYRRSSVGYLVAQSKLQSFVWETMRGIPTIKMFNGIYRRQEQYMSLLSRSVRLQNNIETTNTLFTFFRDMLFATESVLIIYIGSKLVISGQLTVGMLVAFLGFRDNFVAKASNLVDSLVQFRLLGVHLDRLSDILLTKTESDTELPFLGDNEIEGRLEVKSIAYRYGDNEPDVLHDCSLTVAPGEIVAIVGPSGAGKSTLFKILTGQIEPRSGSVCVDGLELQGFGLVRLRNAIGVVRQDDMLFAGTLTENIAFLDEFPDHQRVREAAKKARIDTEIERMPMGYNTLIGTMGTGLSGGQSQRVMLARALYRKPKILLLDEATSHLDIDNEKNIASALRDIRISQVIIAHRPETIARADRVVDIRDINGTNEGNVVNISNVKNSRDSIQ